MMKNGLEIVNIRLVKEPSVYSNTELTAPKEVVELVAKELIQYDREVFLFESENKWAGNQYEYCERRNN